MRDWQPLIGLPLWVWLFVFPSLLALSCILFRPVMARILRPMWAVMDRVYLAFGAIAAVFMVTILLLIVGQMIARWTGRTFTGSTEFAGYAMAATSFFALAYALTKGAHIRVSFLLNLTPFTRLWLDAAAMLVAAITATYFARFAIKTNGLSVLLNERTQGQDKVPEWFLTAVTSLKTWPWNWPAHWAEAGSEWVYTPVWLPQVPMSIGTVLLAVALWDHLTRLLITRETAIKGEAVE